MHSRNEKLNLKSAVLKTATLANQLIETIFSHCAVTVRICIHTVIRAWSHSVYHDTKTNRLAVLCPLLTALAGKANCTPEQDHSETAEQNRTSPWKRQSKMRQKENRRTHPCQDGECKASIVHE